MAFWPCALKGRLAMLRRQIFLPEKFTNQGSQNYHTITKKGPEGPF